ncbi:Hypothetical protein R9X50_00084200 [Acrodontium crateriforme]|uniref:RING zinc finger-like domain-containing protein n=1 Tax=Acrodontium crateriforme TaxID=150365 RepID=A0AAQ3M100_9PEZI|nr:Hypothetical protein R9X50_00084200 [Acrodontium crateriforme]
MPPRASLTSAFPVTDANNEVVCPLQNQDGSGCRKRCLGEKRFRSMQEHIRRAHPEYYIPKLPATKESFELMITSPPHERPQPDHSPNNTHHGLSLSQPHHLPPHTDSTGLSPAFHFDTGLGSSFEGYPSLSTHDGGYYTAGDTEAAAIFHSMQAQQRSSDEYRRGSLMPTASAAAALAQLQYRRADPEWGGNDMAGQVIFPRIQMSPTLTEADFLQNYYADQNDIKSNHFSVDPTLDDDDDSAAFLNDHSGFPTSSNHDPSSLLHSSLAHSPPDRSATLPPLQRFGSRSQSARPRKNSLTHQARLAKHERKRSKEFAKRHSGDRKAFSAEPSAAAIYGKRWEDLIDAATSATEEEGSRDLTPIPASPYQSPSVTGRTPLPPFALGSQFQSFQASPLNRALTPPPAPDNNSNLDLQPFPSVDSSLSSSAGGAHAHHNSADSSGSQFHIMNPSSMDSSSASAVPSQSSPLFTSASTAASSSAPQSHPQLSRQPVQIYCAGCRHLTILKESFACTNCICGLCATCVDAIMSGQSRGRMSMCPRCNGMDSSFKPFQLDLR